MGRKILMFVSPFSFLGFVVAAAGTLFAADQPFYQGKTIRVIISSNPGGGTDTAGRLVSRVLPKYLPGNPKTMVQNMPGAGSIIANNYFTSEVKGDGLTLLMTASSMIESFTRGGSTIKYEPRKYRYIGGIARGGSLVMVRKDARPRLLNRNAPQVVVGDTDGIRTWVALTVWAAEYLGWNLKWIYGYQGGSDLPSRSGKGKSICGARRMPNS